MLTLTSINALWFLLDLLTCLLTYLLSRFSLFLWLIRIRYLELYNNNYFLYSCMMQHASIRVLHILYFCSSFMNDCNANVFALQRVSVLLNSWFIVFVVPWKLFITGRLPCSVSEALASRVLVFVARWRHNFREIAAENCEYSKN